MADDDRERPIAEGTRDIMNGLAQGIDDVLNPGLEKGDRKWGFALFVFPFGARDTDRFNYISNANRYEMAELMQEQIDKIRREQAREAAEKGMN